MSGIPHFWLGESSGYTYEVLPANDLPFKAKFTEVTPANYIFAKRISGQWVALYIGQTDNITERMESKYDGHICAAKEGATHVHVHAHKTDDEDARVKEEDDLIAQQDPPCNKQ